MAAAEDYLKEVGGTDAFSESVYEFLQKEGDLPSSVPAAAAQRTLRRRSSLGHNHTEEPQQEGEEASEDNVMSDDTAAGDGTADGPVSSPKLERVSAPMGALLGLAQQLENMWKEEGAKGWNANGGDSLWEGGGADEFRDVGVDLNAGPGEALSSRESAESGAGQHERRKPLSETSYQQILDELRNKGLSPQQAGQRRLGRSKSELACAKMYEIAIQKINARQQEKEREAEEAARLAKKRGFKAYKKSKQIAKGRLQDANPFDYSEMLYNEAKQIEKRKRALLEVLEAERNKELAECTFAPKVKPFVPLYTARHAGAPVVERMQKMVDEQRARIREMREETEKARAKELTFKPTISETAKRAGSAGGFLKRTRDHIWKKQVEQERAQQEIQAEASLKSVPSINSYSKALELDEPVHQRLYRSARLKEQRSYEEQENRLHETEVPAAVLPEDEILQATEKLFGDEDEKRRRLAAATRANLERTLSLATVKKINQTSVEYAKRKLEKDVRAAFAEVDPECSGIVGGAEIRSVFQKLNVFHPPGARKNRERERSEQRILDRARELMPGRAGIGVDTKAFLGFMELVVEHSLQQQRASLDGGAKEQAETEKPLSPLDKLARDIARRSFHRLSYTQTKVLRESKPNCPPTRAAEIRTSSRPLPFTPSLSRPADPSFPLPITAHVDRSKTTFRWQSKTGELALVPVPGEDVPRSPTRAQQEAHADAILRKGARARERVAALRTELELREREACTFRPALVASPRKVRAARNRRTSVRKEPPPPTAVTKELREMGECTFRPKTLPKAPRNPAAKAPALFDRCIERMRRGHARRHQLRHWQDTRIPEDLADETRVYKRKETRTEPEPFQFVPGRKRAPIVYIEVILSKSRVARIGIERGDKPEKIAANFAKIYDLDDQARAHLATVIRKSVEDIKTQREQSEKALQENLRNAELALARRLSGLMRTSDGGSADVSGVEENPGAGVRTGRPSAERLSRDGGTQVVVGSVENGTRGGEGEAGIEVGTGVEIDGVVVTEVEDLDEMGEVDADFAAEETDGVSSEIEDHE